MFHRDHFSNQNNRSDPSKSINLCFDQQLVRGRVQFPAPSFGLLVKVPEVFGENIFEKSMFNEAFIDLFNIFIHLDSLLLCCLFEKFPT